MKEILDGFKILNDYNTGLPKSKIGFVAENDTLLW